MKELMDFHRQAQETFRVAMKAWRKEAKEFEAKYEDADGDHLIDERDSIESLMDRGHTFGIIGLYTFLERFLKSIDRASACQWCADPELTPTGGLSLHHKMRDYLAQHAQIDMNRSPFEADCHPFDCKEKLHRSRGRLDRRHFCD